MYPGGTETTTDLNGNYFITTSIQTTTEFYVTANDAAGNTSSNSNIVTVTFDNTSPSQPIISSNKTSTNGNVQILGTAESGTTVTLYPGGTETTTDLDGNYSITTSIERQPNFMLLLPMQLEIDQSIQISLQLHLITKHLVNQLFHQIKQVLMVMYNLRYSRKRYNCYFVSWWN